jgi:hypothetical protein
MNERSTPDDTRDVLRELGGLLIGLAALMIYIRKGGVFPSANQNSWDAFPLFLLVAIPAVYLSAAIFTGPRTGRLQVWQVVHSVFGLVFAILALRQLVDVFGGNPTAPLNTFWIFGVTAALAFYAGVVAGIRVQLLFASISLIVSWSALWDELLSGGIGAHYGIWRGLLGIVSIGLLAGALYLWRENPGGDRVVSSTMTPSGDLALWKASELFTGAGIAAVLACGLGITSFAKLFGPVAAPTQVSSIGTNTFWDVLLLVISLGLVVIGSRIGTRGPVYVGAAGLFLFLVIVGFDLDSEQPNPFEFGGWPWVLLIVGVIGLALSFTPEASLGDRPRRFIHNLRGR